MEQKVKNLGTVELATELNDSDTVIVESNGKVRRTTVQTLTDRVSDSINSNIEDAQAAADAATAAAAAATNVANTLQADVSGILAAQGSYMYYAAARAYGAASPLFTKTFGTRESLLATLSHFRLATVKNGKVQHFCAPGRITLASNGDAMAIDGSDGDLMLVTDTRLYRQRMTGDLAGTKSNIIGLGLAPNLVGTFGSKEFAPFAVTPEYTVIGKIFDDAVSQAHCVYNPNLAGQYSTPAAIFKQTVKANGNGYPSNYFSSLSASEQARNKNADVNSNKPYIGGYYEFYELLWEAMYLELGTLDITDPLNFGYGVTNTGPNATNFADAAISGVSGVHIVAPSKDAYYAIYDSPVRITATGSDQQLINGLAGGYYVPLESFEHLRVLDNITKNGLLSYVGNSSAVFTNTGKSVTTDGSINLLTGAGMVAGQKYYQVRNVPNCQGLADGILTAVVNVYIKFDLADNLYLSDGTTSLAGGVAVMKLSVPVYRGWSFMKGMFQHYEGCHYRQTNTDGTRRMEFWSADSPLDLNVIRTTTGYADGNEVNGVLKGLKLRFTTDMSSGWVIQSDYSGSLFGHVAVGGGQHTYECAYVWKDTSYGYGNAALGKSCVNASVVGCPAAYASAGRSVLANAACSSAHAYYAGAFAVANLDVTLA